MMWAPQEKSSPTIYHYYYIKNTHTAADISVKPLSDSVSRDMHLTSLGAKFVEQQRKLLFCLTKHFQTCNV